MKYIIGNWKMNMNLEDVQLWIQEIKDRDINVIKRVHALIAPSSIHINSCNYMVDLGINLCGQDISQEEKGAHTGELGAYQLKEFCDFCIIGHSERNENIELVTKKRNMCLKYNITPVVCVKSHSDAIKVYCSDIILAWEDPDNISVNGVYKEKNPDDIRNFILKLRSELPKDAKIIYGGSVNERNALNLANIHELDGVLTGNASLKSSTFFEIIKKFA